jgi:hypothetical protein
MHDEPEIFRVSNADEPENGPLLKKLRIPVHTIKEPLKVGVYNPIIPFLYMIPRPLNRHMRASPRPEARSCSPGSPCQRHY